MKSNNDSKQDSRTRYNQSPTRFLTLHNDNVNSFDFVMETLIEVCEHDDIQAEQCTFLAHHKGQIDVKKGTIQYLEPYQLELINRGLKATID
jgi:ATP-dependent Clp protease adaptor protein ClpS